MDFRQRGSSIHGILQAEVLECVAIPFCRASYQPSDWTQISCVAHRFFTFWATREAKSQREILELKYTISKWSIH